MTQMVHVDVGAILQTTVNSVYTDLVTRATGRTVRTRIEQHIGGERSSLAVIDFSRVGLLDFSCADEIIATLMRQCCAGPDADDRYVMFAGISDAHLDAIEHVLERHGLALVVRFSGLGAPTLVGMVDTVERRIWEAVVMLQPVGVEGVARETGLTTTEAADRLRALHTRRLLMRDGSAYRAPIGALA